jgi:hypothetical protein
VVDRPEQALHKAVVAHLRQRGAPGLVFFHVPNGAMLGGKRSRKGIAIQGSIMKGLGVRAGVADLILLRNGHAYALELKADGGRPTLAQMEFMSDWHAAGGFGCIVEGLDRALRCLETWGLLRGQASVGATMPPSHPMPPTRELVTP